MDGTWAEKLYGTVTADYGLDGRVGPRPIYDHLAPESLDGVFTLEGAPILTVVRDHPHQNGGTTSVRPTSAPTAAPARLPPGAAAGQTSVNSSASRGGDIPTDGHTWGGGGGAALASVPAAARL